MAIKNIIWRGFGFSPGSVKWIPTRGYSTVPVLSHGHVDNQLAVVTGFGAQEAVVTGFGSQEAFVAGYQSQQGRQG